MADEVRDPGGGRPLLFPTTYGFNLGRYFVFNPQTRRGGDGLFYPNSFLKMGAITDGTSSTLLAAEVKAWTPYMRNGGPSTTVIPATAEEAASIVASGSQFKNTGHTEWPDGRVHHSGFTTAMPPNANVVYQNGSTTYVETDFNAWQEGKNGALGSPSYAIITSRSFHKGIVNVTLADGSVHSVSENIDLAIWRALSTRSGGELAQIEP